MALARGDCNVKHPEGLGVCELEDGHTGSHECAYKRRRLLWMHKPKPGDRRGVKAPTEVDPLSRPSLLEAADKAVKDLAAAKVDPVKHPSHYTSHPSGVECLTITRHMNFNLGNAVKYIWRAGLKSKDPVQDLEKAVFYLQDEIRRLQGT